MLPNNDHQRRHHESKHVAGHMPRGLRRPAHHHDPKHREAASHQRYPPRAAPASLVMVLALPASLTIAHTFLTALCQEYLGDLENIRDLA